MINRSNELRSNNRNLIIREILTRERTSRQEIIRRTGLAPSTVSSITGELLEEGIICKSGSIGSPGTGRKTDLISRNGSHSRILVINLTFESSKIALVDLELNIVRSLDVNIRNFETENVVKVLEEQIAVFLGDADDWNIKAMVLTLPHYPYEKNRICELLFNKYSFPILTINNVEAMGMYDCNYLYSSADFRSLVYIFIGKGIGSAFFHQGELFTGENGYASDLGHVHITEQKLQCRCGRYGCLETVASEDSLSARLKEIEEMKGGELNDEVIFSLKKGIDQKNSEIQNLVGTMAEYMAEAILTVISLLDPQVIILTGRLMSLNPYYSNRLEDYLYRHSGRRSVYENPVRYQEYRPDSAVKGAALYGYLSVLNG